MSPYFWMILLWVFFKNVFFLLCARSRKGTRKNAVFANTLFKSVAFGEEELQILTCGTDRKLGYWETYDGSMIRELEGSKSGAINSLDMTADQRCFVTGGEEKLVKVSQGWVNFGWEVYVSDFESTIFIPNKSWTFFLQKPLVSNNIHSFIPSGYWVGAC